MISENGVLHLSAITVTVTRGRAAVWLERVGRGFTWTLRAADGTRLAASPTTFSGPRAAKFDLNAVRRLVATQRCAFVVERFAAPHWRWSCEYRGVVVANGQVLRHDQEHSLHDVELFIDSVMQCDLETPLLGVTG